MVRVTGFSKETAKPMGFVMEKVKETPKGRVMDSRMGTVTPMGFARGIWMAMLSRRLHVPQPASGR
jgi:hypothetical protein